MDLKDLLSPRSVAVVGASQEPSRIGGHLIRYLRRHGFSGNIYPVNPKYDQINGLKCYAALADIRPTPDVVLVTVPEKAVFLVLAQARACRIKNAIVYSSGFSETGAEGRLKQEQIDPRPWRRICAYAGRTVSESLTSTTALTCLFHSF